MSNVIPLPISVRVGVTNVAVTQAHSGKWLVFLWAPDNEQGVLGAPTDYQDALKRAQTYVSNNQGCVLDLPAALGKIHVQLSATHGSYEVQHESASGESWAFLKRFGLHQRDDAVRFALSQLGQYSPCQLGQVAA